MSELKLYKMGANKTENVLLDYLTKKTNYALLLTGAWGTGKTYYITKTFMDKAKRVPTINKGAKKKYEPVLVSLFGVKSIDDVKDRILISLYPLLGNRYLKTTGTLVKAVLKSIDVTKLLGKGILDDAMTSIADAGTELKKQSKEYLDFSNLLLCFDDLERIDKKYLTGNEILGFINSLVEHENIKVIIIANEGKIDHKVFQKIKEKTIGHTLHFEQDFYETLQNIVSNSEFTGKYAGYIDTNKVKIYQLLQREWNEGVDINYRTVQYILSTFGEIYYNIDRNLGISALEGKIDHIRFEILKFVLAISIEYKKGEISYRDSKGIDDDQLLIISSIRNKDQVPKGYVEEFLKKYFPNDNYTFYKSIYAFVTGGDSLDFDKFKEELKHIYHVKDDEIPDCYKVYNKLAAAEYYIIEDEENKELLLELYEYAIRGVFATHEYLTVFYFLFRDGNILVMKHDTICKKFLRVIRKLKSHHKYHPLLDKHMTIYEQGEFYEYYLSLKNEILKVNEEVRRDNIKAERLELETLINTDFDKFYHKVMEAQYSQKAISFQSIRPTMFSNAFKRISNKQKLDFIYLISVRFLDKNKTLGFTDDLELLKALKTKIDNIVRKKPINNSGVLYRELQQTLGLSINSIKDLNDLYAPPI